MSVSIIQKKSIHGKWMLSDDDFTAGTSYRRSHNVLNISAKSLTSVVQSLADRLANAFGIYI